LQRIAHVESASHATPAVGRVEPRRLLAYLDAGIVAVGLLAAVAAFPLRNLDSTRAEFSHVLVLALIYLVLGFLLFRDGRYSSIHRVTRVDETVSLLRSMVVAYLVVQGAAFATRGFFTGYTNDSRLIVFGDMILVLGLMVAARFGVRAYQTRRFARGESLRSVLVAGSGQAAVDFVRFIAHRPWLGVQCAGRLAIAGEGAHYTRRQDDPVVPWVGDLTEARAALPARGAAEVIVALDPEDFARLAAVTEILLADGVPFRLVPSLFEHGYRAAKVNGFDELPLVDMVVDPFDQVQLAVKRACDVVGAVVALALMSPVLVTAAMAVKVTSPGPVFFRQERVGRNGRHFPMLKFRTMVKDAEERLVELEGRNEAESPLFKIRADPRLTRVGAFLRTWSLDEFPQFFNVLRGEMSVVGPRPPLPREVERYDTHHHCRLKVKPGITGPWQVSGRSGLGFDDMVRLDRSYIENWSLSLDLSIVLKTFRAVLGRRGAY
jgi:exopolysaccharide biosynthesis polyprenyl glycosylphosphotransferase